MNEYGRIGIPRAPEFQQAFDMARSRRRVTRKRIGDVVHAELQMPLRFHAFGRVDHVLRRQQRHQMRRLVTRNRLRHGRKRRDQYPRHGI